MIYHVTTSHWMIILKMKRIEIELEVKFEHNIDIDGIINIAKKYNADILIHVMNEDENKEVSIHIDKDGNIKRKILIDESMF